MKKPRLPTPEEIALFEASNKGVKVRKPSAKTPLTPTPKEPKIAVRTPRETALAKPDAGGNGTTLSALTTRELSKRSKPYGAPERTLDLHGLTKLEAYAKVQHFLARAQKNGLRHVAIITGKGRGAEVGVLRKSLPEWLNEPGLRPLVAGFGHAPQEKGGTGVTHVLVKKPR